MSLTCRVAILDTETTGMGAFDEVIELAIGLVECSQESGKTLRIIETYRGLRQPSVPVTAGARRVHGISDEELEGCELDVARVDKLLQGADAIIAHNAPFDRGLLSRTFPYADGLPWRCSCRNINWRGLGFPNAQLQSLLRLHGIESDSAHRAAGDVEALHRLLQRPHPASGRRYLWHVLNPGQERP